MPGRQRAGQQLSGNSHWSLVWNNTGPKGWGVEFTLLSLEPYKTSIIREKGLQFLLKGTETADTSQTWHRHTSPDLQKGVSNRTHQHLLSLPDASHHSHVSAISNSTPVWGQCCQFRLLWAVTPTSLARLWCTSAPHRYLLAADNFQIQKSPINRVLVETNSSVSGTMSVR